MKIKHTPKIEQAFEYFKASIRRQEAKGEYKVFILIERPPITMEPNPKYEVAEKYAFAEFRTLAKAHDFISLVLDEAREPMFDHRKHTLPKDYIDAPKRQRKIVMRKSK